MTAPMTFDWIEVHDVGRYVRDPSWVMEQKLDGMRLLAERTPSGRASFFTHGGQRFASSAGKLRLPPLREWLRSLDVQRLVVDGELVVETGVWWLFDILGFDDTDLTSEPLLHRRAVLEELRRVQTEHVRVVPQFSTTEGKGNLAERVELAGAEGVMLKHVEGTYTPGRRTSRVLKAKFTKTVDCVVLGRNLDGACNAELGVRVIGQANLCSIGRCSMIGKPDARVGDVVEVRYLYATEERVLYQPTLLRVRDDKAPEDCWMDQLVPVSREVMA